MPFDDICCAICSSIIEVNCAPSRESSGPSCGVASRMLFSIIVMNTRVELLGGHLHALLRRSGNLGAQAVETLNVERKALRQIIRGLKWDRYVIAVFLR